MMRPHKWRDKAKHITIFIDDKEVGTVGMQQNLNFDVSPGKHTVMIKNKWGAESKPLEVDLSNNEDKAILMTSSKYVLLSVLVIASTLTIIYSFLRDFLNIDANSFKDTLALLSIYILVFFLFYRKNYLKLKEGVIFEERVKLGKGVKPEFSI